ncbi:hypothetical protein GCM10023229_32710 [Flavisolibacter ginsenosidimutans]
MLFFLKATSQPVFTEVQQSENLLRNGDFMARDPLQRPLNWLTGAGLQTAILSSQQHHGKQPDDLSLKLQDSSQTLDLVLRSDKHVAAPNVNYRVEAWAKYSNGSQQRLLLEFWDQNNKCIAVSEATINADTSWQRYHVEKKAPDQTTHVTVSLTSAKEATGLVYWDDVSLCYDFVYSKLLPLNRRELFLDDYRIQSMNEVQRLVHPAQKSKPLIRPTEPWEGSSVYIYGTVLKDEPQGSGYRMWYTAYLDGQYYLCYATSVNGLVWKKPALNVFNFRGSTRNNICQTGGGTVVYDPDAADSNRRYKLMSVSYQDSGRKFGYGVWFSADGFRWKEYKGNPVLPYADVSNVSYDRDQKLFIATTKQRMVVSNTSVTPNKMDRAAFVSVSKDFIHWTAPDATGSSWLLAVEGDMIDDWAVRAKGGMEGQIYGMTVYPYDSIYIGMPWTFDVMNYKSGIFAGYGDGPIQPQLATSRDLQHWSRLDRDPVIPLGKAGAWDDGTLYTSSTMQVAEKEMVIYYGAMNLPHGGDKKDQKQVAQIATASWRRDGFVSLHNAGDDEGTVVTKAIVTQGSHLQVNAKLLVNGRIRVEILDEDGKPIPGYTSADAVPLTGDNYLTTARWKNNNALNHLHGRAIKLKFYIKGGDLYSYWFTN